MHKTADGGWGKEQRAKNINNEERKRGCATTAAIYQEGASSRTSSALSAVAPLSLVCHSNSDVAKWASTKLSRVPPVARGPGGRGGCVVYEPGCTRTWNAARASMRLPLLGSTNLRAQSGALADNLTSQRKLENIFLLLFSLTPENKIVMREATPQVEM